MKISFPNYNYNNSFGAVKIKPAQRRNNKTEAQLLIENANKIVNDTTAEDSFENTSKKYYGYSNEMKAKKEEISEHIFKSRAMYNAILEE